MERFILDVELTLNSLEDTKKLADIIGGLLFPGAIIGLTGDLGSGKTTFTKYLAKYIGVNDTLNSPTFTILKIYQGDLPLYHMDVYRLEDAGYDYELDEFIYDDGIAVIEWYEFIKEMLPDEILSIKIEFIDETRREVVVKGSGKYEKIIKDISNRYCH